MGIVLGEGEEIVSWGSAERSKVFLRGEVCAYCGNPAHHKEHVTPKCKGGDSRIQNKVYACARCNGKKGRKTPLEAGMPVHSVSQIVRLGLG